MTQVTLRTARSTDAGKLGAMITEAVAANPWKPRLHSGAEDISHAGRMIDHGWVSVAEDDAGQIIGFIAREAADVHALFVMSKAQGKGVGTALLDHAKTQVDSLNLWTFQANTGAQRFYKRHAFAEVERTSGADNDEGLPDVRFLWSKPKSAPTEALATKSKDATT